MSLTDGLNGTFKKNLSSNQISLLISKSDIVTKYPLIFEQIKRGDQDLIKNIIQYEALFVLRTELVYITENASFEKYKDELKHSLKKILIDIDKREPIDFGLIAETIRDDIANKHKSRFPSGPGNSLLFQNKNIDTCLLEGYSKVVDKINQSTYVFSWFGKTFVEESSSVILTRKEKRFKSSGNIEIKLVAMFDSKLSLYEEILSEKTDEELKERVKLNMREALGF